MPTVLIIEDELTLLEEFVFLIESMGYDVLSASDGQAGILLAEAHQPDLILCDVLMPEVDGYSVLRKVRSHAKIALTPFIFLTALAEKEAYRQGMEDGADDYLTKPCSFDELQNALKTQLGKAKLQQDLTRRDVMQRLHQQKDAERAFIAEQMHNYLGSILRSIGIVSTTRSAQPQIEYERRLQQVHKLVDEAIDELHAVAMEAHPTMLEHLGLQPALEWLADRHTRQMGTTVHVQVHLSRHETIPQYLEREVYHVVQSFLRMEDGIANTIQLEITTRDSLLQLGAHVYPALDVGEQWVQDVQTQVQIYDGRLWVEQQADCTSLRLSYPLVIKAQTAEQPRQKQSAPSSFASDQIQVLIYNSNSAAALSLRTMLRAIDAITITAIASDPDTLAKTLREQAIDVLLLEPEAYRPSFLNLCQQAGTAILLLAETADRQIIDLMRAGVNGFVLKREGLDEIARALLSVARDALYLGQPLQQAAFSMYINGHTADDQSIQQLSLLTRREREILQWVVAGHTSAEIAHQLTISPRTVETHRANMLKKLDLKSKADLIRLAISAGLDYEI